MSDIFLHKSAKKRPQFFYTKVVIKDLAWPLSRYTAQFLWCPQFFYTKPIKFKIKVSTIFLHTNLLHRFRTLKSKFVNPRYHPYFRFFEKNGILAERGYRYQACFQRCPQFFYTDQFNKIIGMSTIFLHKILSLLNTLVKKLWRKETGKRIRNESRACYSPKPEQLQLVSAHNASHSQFFPNTRPYPPEKDLRTKKYGRKRSDFIAKNQFLGVVFWELQCAKKVFKDKNERNQMNW